MTALNVKIKITGKYEDITDIAMNSIDRSIFCEYIRKKFEMTVTTLADKTKDKCYFALYATFSVSEKNIPFFKNEIANIVNTLVFGNNNVIINIDYGLY